MEPLQKTSMSGLSGSTFQKNSNIARQGLRSGESGPEHENRGLANACADFEAIFVEQLFKTMRASVPKSGLLDGGRAEEIYTDMLDQQVAREMAHGQGGIGLANQMKSRLSPHLAAGRVPDLE